MALRRIKGKQVWIYQVYVNGKLFCRSTGQTDRSLAEREVPRLMALAESQRYNPDAPRTLKAAIDAEVQRLSEDVSANQAERVSFSFRNFVKFAGDIRIEKITTTMLEQYQRKRLKTRSLSTVNRELIYIIRMLRLNGLHVQKPTPKPGKVTGQRAFTHEELMRLCEVCPPHLKPLYLLMLASGGRQAEFVPSDRSTHKPLLKSELDLEKRIMRLRTAKQREGAAKSRPKIRVIPLPEWVIEPLKEQMSRTKGEFVFAPLINPSRQFDDVLKKASIPKYDILGQKLTSHSFRHHYSTVMAEMLGQNAFLLKEVLAHSRISTTERYVHSVAPCLEIAIPMPVKKEEGGAM